MRKHMEAYDLAFTRLCLHKSWAIETMLIPGRGEEIKGSKECRKAVGSFRNGT